jgi:hypothetical protein
MIPEIFEVCKADFKNKRLRNLCTLRPVSLEEDDDSESDSESTHTSSTPDKQESPPKKPEDVEMPKSNQETELIVTNSDPVNEPVGNYGFS